jgi:lipopolysaccharide export system permease protein
MIVFIATIFFTSRMTANSEIVAILTGGVSFKRLMWPYFVAATILASLSYTLGHFIIPKTNIDRLNFQTTYINREVDDRFKNIHRQVKQGHIIYFENYNASRKSGYHFTYEVFENNVLKSKLKSDLIKLDTNTGRWKLDNYVIRTIAEDGSEKLEAGRSLDTLLPFQSNEIVPKLFTIEMMTTPELNKFIKAERLRGSENLNFYLIEKYKRTSYPVSTFILVLIGVSIASKKTRGGLGLNIAIGLAVCVAYIFFMQISTTFATIGNFSPLIAVWIPNMVFSVIALYLYYIAPK